MVVPVTVVTLTVGSILSMKTVIVGMVTEKTVTMVAGKLLSREERVHMKPLNSMTLPDLFRILIFCLHRGSNCNWVW